MSSLSRIPLPKEHPDCRRLAPIAEFLESPNRFGERLTREFPFLVDEVLNQALDPTRTGRTGFAELTPEEKKNIGSLIETRIRDILGVPRSRRDLLILGEEVDVKNTTGTTWMIPRESYELAADKEPGILLLSQYSAENRSCNLGLVAARKAYLTAGANRDGKLSISASGRENVWWLLRDVQIPPDIWAGIDLALYRRLRQQKGGTKRAAEFFSRHINVRVERSIVQSLLFDQKDYMKRLRKNGGARDILSQNQIALNTDEQEYLSADGGKRWYSYWRATHADPATLQSLPKQPGEEQ